MRYQQILLSFLLFLFTICGYISLSFHERRLFSYSGQTSEVESLLQEFLEKYKPISIVDLNSMYGTSGKFEVLHPLLELQSRILAQGMKTCHEPGTESTGIGFEETPEKACNDAQLPFEKEPNRFLAEYSSAQARLKSTLVKEARATGRTLPTSFLLMPPFVDEKGDSYALWLVHSGTKPYSEKKWIEQHLSYFTLKELKGILETYHIQDPVYQILTQVEEREIEDLVKGSELVLSKEYLFVKNQSRFGFSPLSFLVYRNYDFNEFLRTNGDKYALALDSSDIFCLQRSGNACWTYSPHHFMNYLYRHSLLILFTIGLVFIFLLLSYMRRVRNQQTEQKKRRLSLQVLSHEFRTPVASMLLTIEQLRENSLRYDQETQDLITRMSTDVFRLQRIIEVSKTYLRAESDRIYFNFVEIPSVNDWLTDFVGEYITSNQKLSPAHLELSLLKRDVSIRADPFWLRFVLTNFVQNAFAHGKAPVCIRIENFSGKLKLTVQDQGHCEFDSLLQMTDPFVKGNRSKGMGLGLNIIKRVVEEWGCQISFSPAPTAFSLEFPLKN
jgi:anti-sigma regulatory factor (Ser/Thr protein kinase)